MTELPPNRPKPDPKHAQRFTTGQLAKMREQAVEQGYEPPRGRTSIESPDAKRKQSELRKSDEKQEFLTKALSTLQEQLDRLDTSIRLAERVLADLRKKPYELTMLVNRENAMPDNSRRIAATEDAILGYKLRRESLAEAQKALESGGKLPADLGQTLRLIEKEAAKELANNKQESEGNPLQGVMLKKDRERLEAISDLIRDLDV